MAKSATLAFSRKIKLGPALGDWTTIKYHDPNLDEINISQVANINFDHIDRETMRYVHFFHYRLAEKLAKQISEDLEIKVELHSITAKQLSYAHFLKSQSERLIQTDLILGSLGKVNFLLDWGLAEMFVDRLAGGRGEEKDRKTFTDVENDMIRTQLAITLPVFAEQWKHIVPEDKISLHFHIGQYKPNKRISARDAVVLFQFNLYFGKGNLKKWVVAYPTNVLRHLLKQRQAVADPLKKRVALNKKTLDAIKVPIKAKLGHASLTMRELKNLSKGDVIALEEDLAQPVQVQIGNVATLKGQPGVVDDKVSVQLIFLEGDHAGQIQSPILAPQTSNIPEDNIPYASETPIDSDTANTAGIHSPPTDPESPEIAADTYLQDPEASFNDDEQSTQDHATAENSDIPEPAETLPDREVESNDADTDIAEDTDTDFTDNEENDAFATPSDTEAEDVSASYEEADGTANDDAEPATAFEETTDSEATDTIAGADENTESSVSDDAEDDDEDFSWDDLDDEF